jgi:hypothetical protein
VYVSKPISMKFIALKTTAFLLILLIASSCATTGGVGANPNAPGQQKKATGAKSAKEFAPGQQKKKP